MGMQRCKHCLQSRSWRRAVAAQRQRQPEADAKCSALHAQTRSRLFNCYNFQLAVHESTSKIGWRACSCHAHINVTSGGLTRCRVHVTGSSPSTQRPRAHQQTHVVNNQPSDATSRGFVPRARRHRSAAAATAVALAARRPPGAAVTPECTQPSPPPPAGTVTCGSLLVSG